MINILFICTGNTCRSPMAEFLLRERAEKLGLPVSVKSAGLAAFPGDTASENAVKVMAEKGIDMSGFRSSRLNEYLLDEADLIVCMTQSHRQALSRLVPPEKLIVPPRGIPDPYGSDERGYRECRDALEDFIDGLVRRLSMLKIEKMTAENYLAAFEIEKECFPDPWSENSLLEETGNPSAHFFVGTVCGENAGYIGTNVVLDECYVANLAVCKDFRLRGVGSALLKHAEENARRLGCSFITLEVRESNAAARALYEKHGFSVCGKRKRFYRSPVEDGLIMTKYFTEEKDPQNTERDEKNENSCD